MSIDAILVPRAIPVETKRSPYQRGYLVPIQIAFATFGCFRQRDHNRAVELLVAPAPIQRRRQRDQFALGGRLLDTATNTSSSALVGLRTAPSKIGAAIFLRYFGDEFV